MADKVNKTLTTQESPLGLPDNSVMTTMQPRVMVEGQGALGRCHEGVAHLGSQRLPSQWN